MIDRKKVGAFVRPLYQDLDGVSRFAEVERIERIARQLHPVDDDAFTLLLLFHALGKWLDKVGNLSRASLTTGIDETTLRRTAASIRRLAEPQTDAERAVAAAVLIDGAGVRGLADRFSRARREGQSLLDVLSESLADAWIPEWLPENARPLLQTRHEARREMCRRILEEL